MRNIYVALFLLIGTTGKLFSQTITITGNENPDPGSQEYYEASFDYSVSSATGFTWIVTGGTIINQSINPTLTVWCIVEWDNTNGEGTLSLEDDLMGISGGTFVIIGQPQATCENANAGPDVTICLGGAATIGTPASPGYTYSWSPTTGLNDAFIAQPTANPTSTTTYTLTVLKNLISNGDFEQGINIGYNTDYPVYPQRIGDGGYQLISTNPQINNGPWCNATDHSINGVNMLIFDAPYDAPAVNYRLWYQTFNVTTNTDYKFSGYYLKLSGLSDFRITCSGNNTPPTTQTIQTVNQCAWQYFEYSFNSGSNTEITIDMRFIHTSSSNDLAFDDLSFTDCPGGTDDITVNVSSAAPTITPIGPITYYNQYESTNYATLTCAGFGNHQWHKNNLPISNATNPTYDIRVDGLPAFTSYYKCVHSCGTSNIVTFNYIGCDQDSDYPVTIPPGYTCLSNYPISVVQPNMGTGAMYYWDTYYHPSCYSFSGITDIYDNTATFSPSGCTYYTEGIFTRAVATTGTEVRMYFGAGANSACRVVNQQNPNNSISESDPIHDKGKIKLIPNPANTQTTIQSKTGIDRVEIMNISGAVLKRIVVNGASSLTIQLGMFPSGIYSCKVVTKSGTEYLKLLIHR